MSDERGAAREASGCVEAAHQRGAAGRTERLCSTWGAPETDHGERKGPFDGVPLTGAEVSWLVEQSERGRFGRAPNLNLEGAILYAARPHGATLGGAHLELSTPK